MPYILDENGDHILDENNNKIEFNVTYSDNSDIIKYKEQLHINEKDEIDTENRNLIVKEAINDNHAVCKKQLDHLNTSITENIDNKISALQNLINSSIQNLIKAHEAKILTQMLNFRNEQIKNRIQRKYLTIPRKTQTFIDLFSINDVDGKPDNLKDIIILNVWIRRYDRFHNSKGSLVHGDFKHIEFFYNREMTIYQTWFIHSASNWSMDTIVEWLRIPQPISIDNIQPESNENKILNNQ